MQHFLDYPRFVNEKLFDASLFVEMCKRLGMEITNEINERIVMLKAGFESHEEPSGNDLDAEQGDDPVQSTSTLEEDSPMNEVPIPHKERWFLMPSLVHRTWPTRRIWTYFRMRGRNRKN